MGIAGAHVRTCTPAVERRAPPYDKPPVYNPDGNPADRMSGISRVTLGDGTPALLIDNETLCSDHYSGANCSSRGCDAVVMIDAGNGWKEIFNEHLYEKTFNIDEDHELKSIAASVCADDPHCGAAPNDRDMSRDGCKVLIGYEHKHRVWRKLTGFSCASARRAELQQFSRSETVNEAPPRVCLWSSRSLASWC